MTGIPGCYACATTDHANVEPSMNVMNSRRCMFTSPGQAVISLQTSGPKRLPLGLCLSGRLVRPMSKTGQKQKFGRFRGMSASSHNADINCRHRDVRFCADSVAKLFLDHWRQIFRAVRVAIE